MALHEEFAFTPDMTLEQRQEAWINALDSGKYQQAQGTLRIEDSMCCLGVLCDVSELGEWCGNAYNTPRGTAAGIASFAVAESVQLFRGEGGFRKGYDVRIEDGEISIVRLDMTDDRTYQQLTVVNDRHKTEKPFEYIVKIARQYSWLIFSNYEVPVEYQSIGKN